MGLHLVNMNNTAIPANAGKLFCIEQFGSNDSSISVCIVAKRESVRRYCWDVGMEMHEGMKRMERAIGNSP